MFYRKRKKLPRQIYSFIVRLTYSTESDKRLAFTDSRNFRLKLKTNIDRVRLKNIKVHVVQRFRIGTSPEVYLLYEFKTSNSTNILPT